MPIYDYNGTSNTEIGKLYDYNGTSNTQIGKVYDYNGTSNSLIYSAEETLFTGLTQETAIAAGPNTTQTKTSSEYTNNGFTSLAVTGTVGSTVIGQGTYGYAASVKIQGYSSSTWTDLKTYNVGGNNSQSTAATATVNISGYTKIRVVCSITTANTDAYTSGKCYTTNLQGIAT